MLNKYKNRVSKSRSWIFNIPTRSLEITNAALAIAFSLGFILNSLLRISDAFYSTFKYSHILFWFSMLGLGVYQLSLQGCDELNSRIRRSLLAKVFSFIWILIAILFSVSTVFTTALGTYLIMSVATLLVGFELSAQNKEEELEQIKKYKETRNV